MRTENIFIRNVSHKRLTVLKKICVERKISMGVLFDEMAAVYMEALESKDEEHTGKRRKRASKTDEGLEE